jgi:DNA-binding CsgD family transcriptional regulator
VFVATLRETIGELYEMGLSKPEIARQLDLAPATVSYHVGRLIAGRDQRLTSPGNPSSSSGDGGHEAAVSQSQTRFRVAGLLAEALQHMEIARRLGISKATVSYHARRLGRQVDERCARRYDWDAIQRYYDDGHSVRGCIDAVGFSSASWSDAVRRGAIVARPAPCRWPSS